jgi:predicted nucleotidyltransferase
LQKVASLYQETWAVWTRQSRSITGRREAALRLLLQEAQEDAERILSHIAAVYDPLRIWQWGSLVRTERFSEISDIDIAVEGLRGPEEWSAIVGDAMRMTRFSLDIIELEKVDAETADLIRGYGRLVHERRQRG